MPLLFAGGVRLVFSRCCRDNSCEGRSVVNAIWCAALHKVLKADYCLDNRGMATKDAFCLGRKKIIALDKRIYS